ncbi:hypothetical protein OF83DRAFT_1087609, partial [Amylostereum chailletii]
MDAIPAGTQCLLDALCLCSRMVGDGELVVPAPPQPATVTVKSRELSADALRLDAWPRNGRRSVLVPMRMFTAPSCDAPAPRGRRPPTAPARAAPPSTSHVDSEGIPLTHRAWRVVRKGVPRDALNFEADLPVPRDLPLGHVLLKVQAAALNPIGYKLMKLQPNVLANRPAIAEYELAGTVVDPNGTQ